MTKKYAKMPVAGQNATRSSKRIHSEKRWLAAIDPYSDLKFKPVIDYAQEFAQGAGAELYGAYILAPDSLNWMGDFSGPWLKRYKPVVETRAGHVGAALGVDIEVIPSRKAGLKHSVETLIKFAKKIKAECLVVSTHARSGLERWMLGSFAETVILSSPIPVMVVNPARPVLKGARKMLVPTDLSTNSTKFMQKIGAFALKCNCEVILFYKQPDPLDPMIQQGVYAVGGGWVSVQSYIEESGRDSKMKIEKLAARLRVLGLKTDVVTDSTATSLVESIEQCAQDHGAHLIAVLTQTGPVAATLLGSVARSLVRTSPVPVMIYR